MKQGIYEITGNSMIAPGVMKMTLSGDTSEIKRPGQFINIKIDGLFLRRPISVCDRENGIVTIIYKIVGRGTEEMSRMKSGRLDILTGLGNGYDTERAGKRPLLVGGGAGVPPMYMLAKELIKSDASPLVIMGFNSREEIFYENEFKDIGADVIVTTADGSYGLKGFVTDAMKYTSYTYFYACGPEPMLRAVYSASVTDGEFSFEERMGCGFGACMGCSCRTKYGNKRICKDGPVLKKEEIIW